MDQPTEPPTFVCAYFGPFDECHGCGGSLSGILGGRSPRMDNFCSDECATAEQARRDRVDAEHAAQLAARRAREEAFADAVAELIAAGHTYEEADVLLAHMPT